jgi:hypothetical protein
MWFVLDDFGSRSKIGFLNLVKSRCMITQGSDFNVKELLGRAAVAQEVRANNGLIPNMYDGAPPFLWKAWARAALLAYVGGLYFEGTGLCLGPSFAPIVGAADNLAFGADHDEEHPFSAGPYAGWALKPGHVSWMGLAESLAKLIDSGPLVWTSLKARKQIAKLNNIYLNPHMRTIVSAEWCRRPNGKPIENEDLFGRSLSADWTPDNNVVYVPMDFERLELDRNYNWFLRMSSEQVLDTENNFIWAQLLQKAGGKDSLVKL